MKYFFRIFLALLLVSVGFYVWVGYRSSYSEIIATTPEIVPETSSVSYHNAEFGFSLWRPEDSEVVPEPSQGYLPVTRKPVVAILLPDNLSKGTNLAEAGLFIGVSADARAVNGCLVPAKDVAEKAAGSLVVGGVPFQAFTSNDAGAGNLYDLHTYRTIHNGSCYELVELLHSGNIANYTPGQVVEFDREKFTNMLEKMLSGFAFLASAGSGIEGKITLVCSSADSGASCSLEPFLVEFKKGSETVATTTSNFSGSFRRVLSPGQYELHVQNGTSTRCTSVGVVVPANTFISSNISCEMIGL